MDESRESIKIFIEENVKIIDLLDDYEMTYKRVSPTRLKMCCPFHDEDTPSMVIYLESNTFHCFGCARNGNPITFLMYYHKKSFNEVLDMYKDKATTPDAMIFEKIDKSLETKAMDLTKYVRSNKYSLGVFLRGLLRKNPERWDEIDAIHLEMDNFFENEENMDKKSVDDFIAHIIGRVTA